MLFGLSSCRKVVPIVQESGRVHYYSMSVNDTAGMYYDNGDLALAIVQDSDSIRAYFTRPEKYQVSESHKTFDFVGNLKLFGFSLLAVVFLLIFSVVVSKIVIFAKR